MWWVFLIDLLVVLLGLGVLFLVARARIYRKGITTVNAFTEMGQRLEASSRLVKASVNAGEHSAHTEPKTAPARR